MKWKLPIWLTLFYKDRLTKCALTTIVFLLVFLFGNIVLAVKPTVEEFTSGNRKFSTTGHSKAKGINMTLAYPKSWLAKEGERPNIVQKFVSPAEKGFEVMALILIKAIPGRAPSEREQLEFFMPDNMKGTIPPGAQFIRAKATKIEDLPAGILEYTWRQERVGIIINSQFISYSFIYGNNMIGLQCSVSTLEPITPAALAQRMEEFKPLFFLMANSIVLETKWK
jgi:hypothetical protein